VNFVLSENEARVLGCQERESASAWRSRAQAPAQLVEDGHRFQDVLIICAQNRFVSAVILKLESHEDMMFTAEPGSVLLPDLRNIIQ
jgi:hypothetical protein